MGRRKIEIKAIKDDRNRSVTFLKRKGGLFKKAHELSVLCSVDVAVFIFGSNKKLYEYSSGDMRDLIARYTYHGGPNEHKGPSDFNGGADDGSDDEVDGSPPTSQNEPMDAHMMPPQYHGQPPFPHLRHQTPSASPPIPNGFTFIQHPNSIQRAHTPQPPVGSRPASRNDMRRVSQPMAQPGPPQVNGYAFIPQPAIYNPQSQPGMPTTMPPGPQYQYAQPGPNHGPPQHVQQQQHHYDERHSSLPPNFPPQGPPPGNSLPPPPIPHQQRHSVSPQPTPQQLPQSIPQPMPPQSMPQSIQRTSPPQPSSLPPPQVQLPAQAPPPQIQPPQHQQPSPPQQTSQPPPQPVVISEPQPPTPVEPKTDSVPEWHEVKKLPQRKQYSIFTPIDESRSILSQHLAAFQGDSSKDPSTTSPPRNAKSNHVNGNTEQRSQSIDSGAMARGSISSSPPTGKTADGLPSHGLPQPRSRVSISSIPETIFTPPSRQNSLRPGGPLRPRLRVEIPPDGSEDNSTATANSASSPRNPSDGSSLGARRNGEPHATGMVLPPPSPSASALLSAGASGPPNPFARPPPHQNSSGGMNIDTPASALPSRFLNNELLPSPSSFYPDWGFGRGGDSATLPSPLNFATPVVGTGPSFLRDDHVSNKRKSPEVSAGPTSSDPIDHGSEPKRVKVDS